MLDKTEMALLLFLVKDKITNTEPDSFEYYTLIGVEQTLTDMLEDNSTSLQTEPLS